MGPTIDLVQDFELEPTLFASLMFGQSVLIGGVPMTTFPSPDCKVMGFLDFAVHLIQDNSPPGPGLYKVSKKTCDLARDGDHLA